MKYYNKENLVINLNTFGNSKNLKLFKIKKLRFFSGINKHSKIQSIFLYDKQEKSLIDMLIKDPESEISFLFLNDDKQYCFFDGYISNIKVSKINGNLFLCKLFAVSKTIDLDSNYKNKVYQNETYNTFYEDMKQETENIYIDENILNEKMDAIIVRYKETPWQISKRLASHKETVLYPRLEKVLFGESNLVSEHKIDNEYSIISESIYREGEGLFRKINIKTNDLYLTGDKVNINNNEISEKFIVIGSYIILETDVKKSSYEDFFMNYTMISENHKYKKRKYNKNLKALVLHAEIIENDTLSNVAKTRASFYENLNPKFETFSLDNESIEENYSIPYLTPYSIDKTELFTAPECKDNILVSFMNEREESIYTLGSLYNEKDERFLDNNYRNYFTDGAEFILDSLNGEVSLNMENKYKENSKISKITGDDVVIETEKLEGIL